MGFVVAHWRVLLVLALFALAGAVVGVSRHQVAKCRAEVAEFRRAYDLLAQSVQRQNDEVNRWKAEAGKAKQRAATARTKAAPVVEASKRSSESLGAAMRGLRPAECPTAKAVQLVREDLQR